MGSATRRHNWGRRGPSASRGVGRATLAAVTLSLVLLGSACGQVPGAHPAVPGALAGAAVSSASPNGENTTPAAGTTTYQVKLTRPKKEKRPASTSLLGACPVRGSGYIADDFGAPRYAGGYHPHQGNDIFVPFGTPVVAPFDGFAVRSPNLLGGNAVKVYGPLGYVYNAHLSAYGKLGTVRAEDEIGYVGNTGDARGGPPHDHFEWHPGNGPAVDPFPYLKAACAPA